MKQACITSTSRFSEGFRLTVEAFVQILTYVYICALPVDDELIGEALVAFGAEDVRALKVGGQKTVRLVRIAERELVLKVIAVESDEPNALRRAQREVELLQQIDHDNVVKVASDLVELGNPVCGAAWLEEYLEGTDLIDELGTQWAWPDVKSMALDVAKGLSALHEVRVVHRDLSAHNVRRTSDGHYVLMDPGFARHMLRSGLTVGGQPGTLGYLSPEHLQSYSGAPTPASDVFCVGVLMYTALAGQQPIPYEGDPGEYLMRLAEVAIPDISDFRDDLSPEALTLLERTMHPQPARRPRNGAQLAEALEEVQ